MLEFIFISFLLIFLADVFAFRSGILGYFKFVAEDLKTLEQSNVDKDKILYLENLCKEICQKHQIPVPTILVQESDKYNATAVSFFGSPIVYFQSSLVLNENKEVLGSVLGHELYHIKENHVLNRNILFYSLKYIFLGIILICASPIFAHVDKIMKYLMYFNVCTYHLISNSFATYTFNFVSRKQELQCDLFAAENVGLNVYLNQVDIFQNRPIKKKSKFDEFKRKILYFKDMLENTHPTWDQRKIFVQNHLKKEQ